MIHLMLAEEGIDREAEGHYRDIAGIANTSGQHTHNFFEFFLIVEGSAYHCVNGERVLLTEGALVFMRPADVHYYERLPGIDLRLINLSFYERTLLELFAFLGPGFPRDSFLNAPNPVTVQLSQQDKLLLLRRMAKLCLIPQQDKQRFRAELRALLAEVYSRYLSDLTLPEAGGAKPHWLLELGKEMRKPEFFLAGMPAMLELSGKSHAHLCRVFQQWEHQSPVQYIAGLRLQYAENLLLHSDRSVLDIALDAGYGNLGHFYKSFKALFGCTPQAYRKQHGTTLPAPV